jgi:DNA-binding NarL/FixJ family response regulator
MLNDDESVLGAIEAGATLLLVNRVLDGGFEGSEGVELIRAFKASHPDVRTMLISNYADAQASAQAAGALEGFGKSEIGSARMKQLLAEAV